MPAAVNPLDLTGKRVLVTGASSGIGRATALLLADLGASLTLVARRAEVLEEVRVAMPEPDRHVVAPFDLADVDRIAPWMKERVGAAGGPFDGVVHAAGMGGATPLRVLSRKAVDAVALPNMYAVLGLLRAVASKGVAADGCSVVLLSSAAALVGSPGLVAYSATKGAVQAVVRSAAVELQGRRVRVNAVAPGYVAAPMMEQSRAELPGGDAAVARQFLGMISPEEVAAAVAYLLSDAARRVTGSTLVIDGGFTC